MSQKHSIRDKQRQYLAKIKREQDERERDRIFKEKQYLSFFTRRWGIEFANMEKKCTRELPFRPFEIEIESISDILPYIEKANQHYRIFRRRWYHKVAFEIFVWLFIAFGLFIGLWPIWGLLALYMEWIR